MKRILHIATLLALVLAAPLARAWVYHDGDVLLIFRENGFDDVEFDLGNISQFSTRPTGPPARSAVGTPASGHKHIRLGFDRSERDSARHYQQDEQQPSSWVSGPEPDTTAYSVSPSAWQSSLYATINALGTRPVIYSIPTASSSSPGGALPSPDTNGYEFDPTAAYQIASYDWIVSGTITLGNAIYPNTAYLPSLGGKSPFIVESVIPASFDFWQIQPSTATPAPADTYVGQFSITADGTLTFVAGAPASSITGHHADGKRQRRFIHHRRRGTLLAGIHQHAGRAGFPVAGGQRAYSWRRIERFTHLHQFQRDRILPGHSIPIAALEAKAATRREDNHNE
jgi:hypothetical protein